MNKDNSVLINIKNWDALKKFATTVMKFESDINIYHESDYYDAKSILAITALSMTIPRYVEIISNDKNEITRFINEMEQFRVDE